jgi:hypothetical protein
MIPNLPARTQKAHRLARTDKVTREDTLEDGTIVFKVRGTAKDSYLVFLHPNESFTCSCEDFEFKSGDWYNGEEDRKELMICKHVQSVIMFIMVEQDRLEEDQEVLQILDSKKDEQNKLEVK